MPAWTWKELEYIWDHPDWTAAEIAEALGRHTPSAVKSCRTRIGRYNPAHVPRCCGCDQRPVWAESAKAKRYGLCKSCFLDEERMRLEDEARAVAIRQRRRKLKVKRDRQGKV